MTLPSGLTPWVLLAVLAGCADLTAPSRDRDRHEAAENTPPGASAAHPSGDEMTAAHVLVAYRDAQRSKATRSKDEARALATQVLDRARKGEDFAHLAQEFSDDTQSKQSGGRLPPFTRQALVKPFADAAFALKPGELSAVVETPYGFHVIKRIE
jgi:parvulin-like peptidyl-prolyl isomerase